MLPDYTKLNPQSPKPRLLWPIIARDTVLVRILEHEEELDDWILFGLLNWSESDRLRIGRFRHQATKTSWCLARWLLESAIYSVTGDPCAIEKLKVSTFGKPYIMDSKLYFNWSHSKGCIALAIAWEHEVGVDVEACSRLHWNYLEVAEFLFSPNERAWIEETDYERGWLRFLSLFVQKEAILKANGIGFDASITETPVTLVLPPAKGEHWVLNKLDGEDEYFLSAVAIFDSNIKPSNFIIERTNLEVDSSGHPLVIEQ
jgi:4'-phosphopantetheinyl transferase